MNIILVAYTGFEDTGFFERYMQNIYQFASAKNGAENKLLQQLVMKSKSYADFRKQAIEVSNVFNKTWLRTEYDVAKRGSVLADKWNEMDKNKDIYPYWRYKGRMDEREREDHKDLEGLVFKIGDPKGDSIHPANGWNCRCTSIPVDGQYIQEKGLRVETEADTAKLLDKHIAEEWRFNPGKGGVLPTKAKYFDVVDIDKTNYKTFGLGNKEGDKLELSSEPMLLGGKNMIHYTKIVLDWRDKYHVNKEGDIIFQNKQLKSNIKFSDNAFHTISHHTAGLANLPRTVERPNECWAIDDTRYYITFGSGNCYIVRTDRGNITDAFLKQSANKYRVGTPLIL